MAEAFNKCMKQQSLVMTKELWKKIDGKKLDKIKDYAWFGLACDNGQAFTSKDPDFWGFIKRNEGGRNVYQSVTWGQKIVKRRDKQLEVWDK